MAIDSVHQKYYRTENKEAQVDQWLDKATILMKDQADRKYAIMENNRRQFKLQFIKYASVVGTLFCGISPYVSERHNRHADTLNKIGVGLLSLAIFTHLCVIVLKKYIKNI